MRQKKYPTLWHMNQSNHLSRWFGCLAINVYICLWALNELRIGFTASTIPIDCRTQSTNGSMYSWHQSAWVLSVSVCRMCLRRLFLTLKFNGAREFTMNERTICIKHADHQNQINAYTNKLAAFSFSTIHAKSWSDYQRNKNKNTGELPNERNIDVEKNYSKWKLMGKKRRSSSNSNNSQVDSHIQRMPRFVFFCQAQRRDQRNHSSVSQSVSQSIAIGGCSNVLQFCRHSSSQPKFPTTIEIPHT